MSQLIPTPPRFEHYAPGLVVGCDRPRLSWSFVTTTAEPPQWVQTAYEIELLSLPADAQPEHYKVVGDSNTLVAWPGKTLTSRARVRVRVRCFGRTKHDIESNTGWSPPSTVEVGLLDPRDWSASSSFITSSRHFGPEFPLQPIRLRKEFAAPERAWSEARLYVTALGVYEVFVNGTRASDACMAPGWTSYRHRLNYACLDVGGLLVRDRPNVVAVEVGEGWYAGKLGFRGGSRFIYGGRSLAILCQLEIDFHDNGGVDRRRRTIPSDESWTCSPSAILSSEIYNGELYDMSKERLWKTAGADVSGHVPARVLSPQPKPLLVAPRAPPVRVIEQRPVQGVSRSASGKTILDFGQNLVGKLLVRECRLPGGQELVLRHAEVLEHGELCTRPLCEARCEDRVVGSGELLRDWAPKFTFHGFRYVQVDGWPGDDAALRDNVVALVMHSDMRRTGHFGCSNKSVNKFHENVVWSMRGNFLSVPTDCPQRDERLGWTGDINIFAPTATFLYDTVGFLEDWLEDLAVEQLREGEGIPGLVCPYVPLPNWPRIPQAVWHDVTIMLPYQLYTITRDAQILRRQFDSMRSWLERGVDRGPDGLWSLYRWQLGDWLDPTAPPDQPALSRTDSVLVADAYLVHVTALFAQICAAVLGGGGGGGAEKEEEQAVAAAEQQQLAARYATQAEALRSAFRAKYVTATGNLVSNTQTGIALALAFGLYAPDQLPTAAAQLAKLVRSARFRLATGFAGTPAIAAALAASGQPQLAYRLLLEAGGPPSWLWPVAAMGATTVWERWDSLLPSGHVHPGRMTSFNHYALGAVARWLHEAVGGLRRLGPRHVAVRPVPGGNLGWAEARLDGACGVFKVRWWTTTTTTTPSAESEGEGGHERRQIFKMELTVPPNSFAYVTLPNESSDKEDVEGSEEGARKVPSGFHCYECLFEPGEWPPKVLLPPNISYTPEMDKVAV